MPLTRAERTCGLWWRSKMQNEIAVLHAGRQPDLTPPPFLHFIRHPCPAQGGRSVAFEYREVYILSPRLAVCYCSAVEEVPDDRLGYFPHEDCQGGVFVEAGRFAFVYRKGECPACRLYALTDPSEGRVVDPADRQPTGRMAASAH
jgi:hypothetical protein